MAMPSGLETKEIQSTYCQFVIKTNNVSSVCKANIRQNKEKLVRVDWKTEEGVETVTLFREDNTEIKREVCI